MSVQYFIEKLSNLKFDNVFNPYSDHCERYDLTGASQKRRELLEKMLEAASKVEIESIWVGRDLGHKGGRRTGLALTDDVHLTAHAERWGIKNVCKFTKEKEVAEHTARVIWSVLSKIPKSRVFLWNVFPLHPYEPGDPLSNRGHNSKERAAGEELLVWLIDFLQPKRIIAVGVDAGKSASRCVEQGTVVEKVRHPAHGGEKVFLSQIKPLYDLVGFRPRRSCLYMPGANARALEKGKTLSADMLIMDLEDSVAPNLKAEARKTIVSAVRKGGYGAREVVVRINGLNTDWGQDDLPAIVKAAPDGVLVPKVCSESEVLAIDQALTEAGAPAGFGLWVMIEMPLAILNIQEIAGKAKETRLTGFVMGTNDLAKELNAVTTPAREAFQVALGLSLAAARAYGLVAIDGVYNDLKNEAGLQAECIQGRNMGFDGKTLIHPAQLAITNQVFSPDQEDVAHAKAIIEAFSQPENQGKGVIKVDGKMTELLHLEQARRLVSVHEAIGSKSRGQST